MSRRIGRGQAGRRARHSSGPAGVARRPTQGSGRWFIVAAALTAVAVLAWLGLRPGGREREGQVQDLTGPASAMSPQAAYQKGLDLSRSGRFDESLLYFRRALMGSPPEPWVIHYNYAGALYSVGLEERGPRGLSTPAVRSSIERVELMRQALAELDISERLATTTRDRATVIRARGERFQIWGFPWDAAVQLRQAQWIDPQQESNAGAADAYMLVLEHPERWRRP